MKPRWHRPLTSPPSMAQRHSTPYSSPSPMWLIVVSSAVATRHCSRPQPSLLSSASSISSPPPSPLYCRAFLLLLPPFSIAVTVAATVSSSYLRRILFDCFVLSVVVVVRCRVVSLLILKILVSAGATPLSPRHRLPTLSALALSSI
jgi:hypothetical protein